MNETSPRQLAPKLEAVLAQLCTKIGPLAKTKAVKLPYLVDIVAQHHLGRPVTGSDHQTWDYGVVTREVYRFLTHGSSDDRFVIEDSPYSEGAVQIRFIGEPISVLTQEESAVVDAVAEIYGSLDAFSLGAMTKSLNTDLSRSDGEPVWGSNHRAHIGEDAYGRLSESRRDLFQQLQALDFSDRSRWGEAIEDTDAYLNDALYG